MLTLVVVGSGWGMDNAATTRDKYRLAMNRMEDPVIDRFQKSFISRLNVMIYS